MESFAEIVPQVVLRIFAPLLGFCIAGWVLLQLPSFKSRMWSKLGKAVCVGLVALAIACTSLIGKNTKGVNGVGGMYLMQFNPPVVQSVTPENISNGWRVAGVSDAGAFAPPPANAVTNERWRLRGAHDDAFRIPADGWSYPFASGVTVLSRGEIRTRIRAHDFPPAFDQDISLVPNFNWSLLPEGRQESVFWYGSTPSNTLLATWWNAVLGREATNPVCFQAELYTNGGFDYRYEDRTVRHVRVWPFDFDDDGLENSVDPDPLVAGSDAHGTNAEWYNTVCSNVLDALAGDGGASGTPRPTLSWREGVNSNAYYFVDVIATNGPAPIYFFGDCESRLGNPVVVARAFETNRVPLLIGINYAVTSTVPISISIPYEGFATITTNGVSNYNVRWPLNFVFTESIGESNRVYTVTVEPYDPGGVLTWEGGGMRSGISSGCGCGCLGCLGYSVMFSCSATCTCNGACQAVGGYAFEDTLFAVTGGVCRCGFYDPPPDSPPSSHGPNDPPSLTITFSKPAVIFEDSFLEKPGVTVPRRSTRVRLTIDAYGGLGGGTLSITGVKMSKLFAIGGNVALPYDDELPPGGSYHATGVYEGVEGSDELNDVEVQGSLVPNYSPYNTSSSTGKLTAVKVALTAEFTARDNPCQTRHTYGVGERVHFDATPALSAVEYRAVKSDTGKPSVYDTFENESTVNASVRRTYTCPMVSISPDITVSLAGSQYRPNLNIVEPSHVVTQKAEFYGVCWPWGECGEAGLRTWNYIAPFHVSFQGVAVSEIPCDERIPPTGYFTNLTTHLTHGVDEGAGNATWIKANNYWTVDDAFTTSFITNWTHGTLYWKIPIGWHRKQFSGNGWHSIDEPDYEINTNRNSRALLIGGRTDAYLQRRVIQEDGTFVTEKYGYWTSRTRWCHVMLGRYGEEGETVQWFHHSQ